jgi:uncharacterized protein (DUF488 family)
LASVDRGTLATVGCPSVIWTVGHSNHPFERLTELLRIEAIEAIADVRSYPYSRIAPQFNREHLALALPELGVSYVFLGEQLGGRPAFDEDYDEDGHARYDRMAERPAFKQAVEWLCRGAGRRRIALLCSEGRPEECHRRLLVGKVLTNEGAQLRHILPDGSICQEDSVSSGRPDSQESLFGEDAATWRSTRSVSHRRRLSASSAA